MQRRIEENYKNVCTYILKSIKWPCLFLNLRFTASLLTSFKYARIIILIHFFHREKGSNLTKPEDFIDI